MRFQAPRGTEDVLPSDSAKWQWVEREFLDLAARYGYAEVRTPVFEDYELFVRTSGETSDVVSKEMYDFFDKGGRHLALKPEGTAPVMRALIEHSLCAPGQVARLSYVTPCYRYGRPQKGRLRELHQLGLELVGSASPEADAEVIEVTARFYQRLGLRDLEVRINSIGRAECRERYRQVVLDHFDGYLGAQEPEQRERARANPLRLLDTKDPEAEPLKASVPPILDFLEPEARDNFQALQALLKEAGIPFEIDPRIVRGLDYYTDTVFEIQSSRLGAQNSLCGGGRYDGLIKELGGPELPAVGVGIGVERALLVLGELGLGPEPPRPHAFVVRATPGAAEAARGLARTLRDAGLRVVQDYEGRSMKAQLKAADRSGARWALILGDDELARGEVTLRDLRSGEQSPAPYDRLPERLLA